MILETVIGLEIHTQLATKSKIFSKAPTKFGASPNSQACEVDLALPGVLPVLNEQAVIMAIKFGLAINAHINQKNVFARKNYFYPDLPKGYQISQMNLPIVGRGAINITIDNGDTKKIGITRAHLEEDAGKSVHDIFSTSTGIDFNRAGTPLLEIVSEADIRSSAEAVAYAKKIHNLVQYLGIGDGNMAEGSFRCDVNISLRPKGSTKFGMRTELKNLNSFKFIEAAIDYEVARQSDILTSGGKVVQETRLYDPQKNQTLPMRFKEEENDYRYFPDPDLLPIVISDALLAQLKSELPELADEKKARFITELSLSDYDATILTASKALSDYFEQTFNIVGDAKICANWILGELSSILNKAGLVIEKSPVTARDLANLIKRIIDNTISGKIAKEVLTIMFKEGTSADEIIEKKGLKQLTDNAAIEKIISEVIISNPKQVEQYRSGNQKIFGFFVGQVMKATKGKANPKQVNELLKVAIAKM